MTAPPTLSVSTITKLDDYRAFHASMVEQYQDRRRRELELTPGGKPFTTHGYCHVCRRESRFATDFLYSSGRKVEGKPVPNWRERVLCEGCGLNNRVRASIHFFERFLEPLLNSAIYLTEQATPLYKALAKRYPRLIGSEYFGDRIPFGSIDPATGFRNESVTQLSFADAALDYVLSFDVFEHVPNYGAALAECQRVLKPGGVLLFTVPFDKGAQDHLVRARITDDGEIEHLCEPEYHGDPVNAQGCLSFYNFGWRLLEELRQAGFASAEAHFYWSEELGYLGEEQFLFTARKGTSPA